MNAKRKHLQFGNYRLLSSLGQGAFGSVYLCEHIQLGTPAAIKLWMSSTGKEVEEFLAAAHILARLNHPHIIRLLDFGVEDDTAFLVTTYASNGQISDHYRIGIPVQLTTILPHVRQIASALQYIHDQKIVHCEVTPYNILLDSNNEVLLCDFGKAVVLHNWDASTTSKVVGTPAYMPPEQFAGKPVPATDQYALGIIVYQWLCGKLPFQGSVEQVIAQQLSVSPPSLRQKVPTLPSKVEEVVMISLAKDPKQRFDSVKAFATALEQTC